MTDRDIWENADWVARRQEYRRRTQWYEGTPLDISEEARDRNTGDRIKQFPLRINLAKLSCDIHRDLARGIPPRGDPLIVRAVVERSDDNSESAERAEVIINDKLWRPSHGGPMQQEALLAMNIYDGVAFKLSWEPWDTDLPYRLAVRLIRNPGFISPVWDPQNPWRMLECYYGFEISPEVAKIKYNITPRQDNVPVLYMEHWTRDRWSVQVDERVPKIKWDSGEYELKGDNPWGIVPFYYIPHERTTKLFGDSQIDGQEEINKDINSKMATLSDTVRASWPGLLWGHDLDPTLKVRRIVHEGKVLGFVIDTGRTRNVQGSQPPTLNAIPMPDIPAAVANFPQDLLDFWMMMERVSPAVFGMDDTQSGRITGPVVANRMWTSMAHSTTECVNFSEGKTVLDKDALRILMERQSHLEQLGIRSPGINEEMLSAEILQTWPPMIPADRSDKHLEMIQRLAQYGISPQTYLREMGIDDIKGELERIQEWMEFEAKVAAEAKPNEPGNESSPA